jgi:hypothetical protein
MGAFARSLWALSIAFVIQNANALITKPDVLPPRFNPIETVGRIPQAVGTAYNSA